jgi:protein TonB
MTMPNRPDDVQAPLAVPTYLTHITAPKFRRGRAIGIAIALHVLALIGILLIVHFRLQPPPDDEPTVALVMQVSPYTGTGPQSLAAAPAAPAAVPPPPKPVAPQPAPVKAAPAPPPPAAPAPMTAAPTLLPPLPQAAAPSDIPLPPPPAPPAPVKDAAAPAPAKPAPQAVPKPVPAASPPAQEASRAHNGNNQPAGAALVMGAHIIPAKPDAHTNQPPPYPPDALAHREEGRVLLEIHILPNGRPVSISVATSSGYTVLDNAARDAVMDWHFTPAQQFGRPVASVLPFWIAFQLN